jgi:hypothetical protein
MYGGATMVRWTTFLIAGLHDVVLCSGPRVSPYLSLKELFFYGYATYHFTNRERVVKHRYEKCCVGWGWNVFMLTSRHCMQKRFQEGKNAINNYNTYIYIYIYTQSGAKVTSHSVSIALPPVSSHEKLARLLEKVKRKCISSYEGNLMHQTTFF